MCSPILSTSSGGAGMVTPLWWPGTRGILGSMICRGTRRSGRAERSPWRPQSRLGPAGGWCEGAPPPPAGRLSQGQWDGPRPGTQGRGAQPLLPRRARAHSPGPGTRGSRCTWPTRLSGAREQRLQHRLKSTCCSDQPLGRDGERSDSAGRPPGWPGLRALRWGGRRGCWGPLEARRPCHPASPGPCPAQGPPASKFPALHPPPGAAPANLQGGNPPASLHLTPQIQNHSLAPSPPRPPHAPTQKSLHLAQNLKGGPVHAPGQRPDWAPAHSAHSPGPHSDHTDGPLCSGPRSCAHLTPSWPAPAQQDPTLLLEAGGPPPAGPHIQP